MQPFRKHSSWWLGRAPQHPLSRSSSFWGVENSFGFDIMQIFNNVQMNGWSCSPKHGPAQFTSLSQLFVGMVWNISKTFETLAGSCSPKHGPISFHGVTEPFRLDVMQPFQQLSSWWLGRAPQHPLSRPSSFRGVKHEYRFNVMQTFNNVQMNGWSWSPKHGPAQITVLSQLFVRMAWSFSKTFKSLAGSCYPKHGPVLFTMFRNFFVWMLCNHSENIQVDGWAALPNIPSHGPAHFAALNIFFFWCCANFQQRSNERLVVLPQTRSSSNHAVESTSRPDGVKLFKNIPILSWVVLPQTRPSSFHGVEEPFRMHVMQPFQNLSSWWLGRAAQHPLSRPSSFHGGEHKYGFDVMQIFNNVQMNGWSCSPKYGPAQFTVLSQLFVRMAPSFLKTFQF